MSSKIKIRRGSIAQWAASNPVLSLGEPGFVTDSNQLKIGDGVTEWNDLPYLNEDLLSINDALLFKGTIGDGGTVTSIPSVYEAGWTYKVITAGTYADNACEFGDLIISIVDRPEGGGQNSDWVVVQTNIDGAVTSLGGTLNSLAKFSSGLNISDSIISDDGSSVNVSGSLLVNNIFVSTSGHAHTSSDITDFNSSVSGLLPTISNSGDNRVLTSTGSSVGVNAENNLTFDGSLLSVSGNLVVNSGTLNSITFNNIGDPNVSTRQLAWNSSEGSLALALSNTYDMYLGGELHYRVRNETGSPIIAGTAVYASGVAGGSKRITVTPKAADGSIRETRFMGLVTENINNGVNGFTTHFGYIRNIDTRGDYAANGATDKIWASGEPVWAEGDLLYVHPTVAGKLTKVEPKHSISVAIILNRHQSEGKLFVRPTSYGHLDDNHDVAISGATNGQFLQYNSSTDYWVPSSSGNFSTLLVNGTGVSVSGHTHSSSDITDFNSSVSGLLPTVANSGDNRILTSTGTSTGINAESNATFDGTTLAISGVITVDNLKLDGNTISSTNENGNIIIQPSGSGAIQTDISGDSRGIKAIDLQSKRSANNMVAGSPFSVIGGGANNRINSTNGSFGAPFCTIVNGVNNRITGSSNYSGDSYETIFTENIYQARSSIIGGFSNTINRGTDSCIIGGKNNTINNYSGTSCTIIGGRGNTLGASLGWGLMIGSVNSTIAYNGRDSVILRGTNCYITGDNNSILGGTGHNIGYGVGGSYGQAQAGTIVAGSNNIIGGGSQSVIVGGTNNTIDGGSTSVIGGGTDNVISNNTNQACIPGGNGAKSSRRGEISHASGKFANVGDAQHTTLVARASTLSGTFSVTIASPAVFTRNNHNLKVGDTIRLSTTGSLPTGLDTTTTYFVIPAGFTLNSFRVSSTSTAGSAVNTSGSQSGTHSLTVTSTMLTLNNPLGASFSFQERMVLPAKTSWTFTIKLSAYNDTDNESGWWIFRGGIRRNDSNGTALVGSLITESGFESSLNTATANVTANDTLETLQIDVGGVLDKNIRWVAVTDICQVSYGTP